MASLHKTPRPAGLSDSDSDSGETSLLPMHYACIRGDLEKLKQQISASHNFNVDAFFENTHDAKNLLIAACLHGQWEVIKYLLTEKFANPNFKDPSSNTTPLMALAGCENYDVDDKKLVRCAKELVSAGADVNLQNRYGLTPIMTAIQRQRHTLVEYLLNSGADPNIIEFREGRSALFIAAYNGEGQLCRRLIEHGANANIEDKNGWSAPELAKVENYPKLARFLYLIQSTKWRPGGDPKLMEMLENDTARACKAETTLPQKSLVQLLLQDADGEKYFEDFQKHKISYVQLLNLNNEELKQIGVAEIGVRKRILENIQKINNANWQRSSIKYIPNNEIVSSAEAICMIDNTSKHLEHIASSIDYITKRISKSPTDLQYDKEKVRISYLMKFCKDAEGKAKIVQGKFKNLHQKFSEVQHDTELKVVGQIQKGRFMRNGTRKSTFRWQFAPIVALVVTGSFFVAKYMSRS